MSDASQLLTEITLDDLMEIVGDEIDVLKDVLNSFLEDSPKLVQAIQNGFANQDLEAVERNAHTLKSSSRLFRAEQFALQCQDLEDSAREGKWPEIEVLIPKLCENFQLIIEVLTAKLNQL